MMVQSDRQKKLIKWLRIILVLFGLIFSIIGILGFFMNMGKTGRKNEVYYEYRNFGSQFAGIDIDDDGNIYIAEDTRGIIQVYTSKGKFLYGIECDTNGGTFSFMEKDNEIYVSISRGTSLKIVNKTIIETPDIDEKYSRALRFRKNDLLYIFKRSGKVIKESPDGKSEVIELEGFKKEWHPMVYMSIYAIGFGLFGLGSGFFKYALDSTIEYCNKM